MPKTDIDYSNTIIYKITCKDPNVKDVYVGHTTNFVQRKHAHKQGCNNEKSTNYQCKLYKTIRTNGGWNNWTMEIINFFKCRDHYEARIKEQEYFVSLNATLNSIEPLPKPKEVIPKNIVVEATILDTPNAARNAKQYTCEKCNFVCSKQSNYNTHLQTRKHQMIQNDTEKLPENKYTCICGSTYKHSSGYYRHKKTCTYVPPKETPVTEPKEPSQSPSLSETNWLEIIHMLVKENQEIRNLIVTQNNNLADQNKTITEFIKTHASGNTLTNSQNNNNIYNINMFLSEKCKDAQNMSDFIEVIKNKVDMFKIEENGYVNGISKLFIDELKSMEVTERPLHCTDERRSTFYVHNNDTWNKDEDLKDTKRAISHVSHANLKQCIDWSSNVPKSGSEREDHINRSIRLCKEAHKSGQDDKVEKIIRNISKEIPLNKQVISDVLV
jgi:hypothetical protein